MPDHEAFVCYVHADDNAELGRVLQLARDIGNQFAAATGDEMRMVYDRDHLRWGDEWRERLTDAVGRAMFLIPIITPRFFTRDECRREFEHFQRMAERLGRGKLVLPILYMPVNDLSEDNPDPLKALVASLQYEDWTELRFEDRTASDYRRAVYRLALALKDRLEELPDPETQHLIPDANEDDDNVPGVLDTIAENEDSVSQLNTALGAIAMTTREIGELTSESSSHITNTHAQANLANRLLVIGRYAADLAPLVERIEGEVEAYRAALERADLLYDALFLVGDEEPNREAARQLAKSVVEMAETSREAFTNTDGFIAAVQSMEGYSRNLRPIAKRLRLALQKMRDTEPTILGWADDAEDLIGRLDQSEP